jgi:WD40 repeat protein
VLNADGTADLWHVRYDDVARSKQVGVGVTLGAPFNGNGSLVAALGARGRTALTLKDDGIMRLTSVPANRPRGVVPVSATGFVDAIAVSPDGRTVASGGTDEAVRLSTLATSLATPQRLGPDDAKTALVAFAKNGRALAGGGASFGTRVWASRVPPAPGPPRAAHFALGSVSHVAFSRDGTRAVASGLGAQADEPVAQIWTVGTGQPTVRLANKSGLGYAAAFSPTGNRIVTGGDDGTARLWNAVTGASIRRLARGGGEVGAVAYSPTGTLVATGAQDGAVRLWEPNGTLRHTFHEPGPISDIAFSTDGKLIAAAGGTAAGEAAPVTIWNVHTHKRQGPPLPAAANGYEATGVAFSPDGRTVATAGDTGQVNGNVQLWDVRNHTQLGTPIPGDSVAFSRDGRSLVIGNREAGTAILVRDVLWRDLADLRARVCHLVWGNLSKAEWATYAPGLPMHRTCS